MAHHIPASQAAGFGNQTKPVRFAYRYALFQTSQYVDHGASQSLQNGLHRIPAEYRKIADPALAQELFGGLGNLLSEFLMIRF